MCSILSNLNTKILIKYGFNPEMGSDFRPEMPKGLKHHNYIPVLSQVIQFVKINYFTKEYNREIAEKHPVKALQALKDRMIVHRDASFSNKVQYCALFALVSFTISLTAGLLLGSVLASLIIYHIVSKNRDAKEIKKLEANE